MYVHKYVGSSAKKTSKNWGDFFIFSANHKAKSNKSLSKDVKKAVTSSYDTCSYDIQYAPI